VGQDGEADPRKRQRLFQLSILFFLVAKKGVSPAY
jgi:hypothetical protein